ncbi:N-acetyltransferase [Clostridiales bacterium COT073_COT-073]|nr:N-acetyltransferase [Clostridiales bacterium COT073_COT-073]
MKNKGTKMLETERLVLRKFIMDDAFFAYQNWMSDELVTKYLRWQAHENIEITKEVLKSWILQYSNLDFYQWAIVLKENNEPIGSIGAVGQDDKIGMVHIGYCIGSKWWHRGITSEALQAMISFFFNEIGLNRIESQHDPENIYSGKVMKKCGLHYEGTLRQADFNNQGIVDACMYSILREEYEERK